MGESLREPGGDDRSQAFLVLLDRASADVGRLGEIGPDVLSDRDAEAALRDLERLSRRVSALQTRVVGALTARRTDRAVRAAQSNGQSPDTAAGRARRSMEDFLTDQLGVAPSDARRSTTDGQRRGTFEQLDRAGDAGELGVRQARMVADFLEKLRMSANALVRDADLETVEAQAIAYASRHDPVALGRWLRGQLIRLDPRRAEIDESDRRRRRHAAATTDEDGMWHLSAKLAGVDAGIAVQALDAFRTPDPSDTPHGQRRSPGQVTADAFVQMCRAALEADTASMKAGSRPHILITIDYQTLLEQQGIADIDRVGPVPFVEVRRLLADAGVARLLVDPAGVPVEAGRQVRTVPAGLRRLLMQRDGGCIATGCSIPARWCQVAHLEQPFRWDGVLSPHNAALMCHHHHLRYDRHGWKVRWADGRPRLEPASTSWRSPPSSCDRGDPAGVDREVSDPEVSDDHPNSGDPPGVDPDDWPRLVGEAPGAWSLGRAVIPDADPREPCRQGVLKSVSVWTFRCGRFGAKLRGVELLGVDSGRTGSRC